MFDDQTDEIYKNNILNRCLIEKREQKPTLTYIWSNKNDLTLEEQDVYNRLKDKKMLNVSSLVYTLTSKGEVSL